MTIHDSHPFADPDPDPARRFRGRIGGTATLWTAGSDAGRAGLTLTSVLVVLGEPARVLGLVDPDSDLADAVAETGRAVVQLLTWPDRDLAEGFAGTAPAPGGVFRQADFVDTEWGPRLAHATTWAGLRLEESQRGRLVAAAHLRRRAPRGRCGHRSAVAPPGAVGRELGERALGVGLLGDAELIAVGVGHRHPAERVVAAPLHQSGAGGEETVHLCVEVVGGQVDVEPVPARGGVGDLLERHQHRAAGDEQVAAAVGIGNLAADLVGPPAWPA